MITTSILTPAQYGVAVASHPDLAFPLLVVSWSSLFLVLYKAVHHIIDPRNRPSLPILPLGVSATTVEEWANRTVSTFHAAVAFWGSIHWYLVDRKLLVTDGDFGFLNSRLCNYYLGVTLGYLVFDLLRLLYFKFVAPSSNGSASAPVTSMFIHHVVIIVAYYLGVRYHFGTFYMALFLNNEITTPFLNARFLMAERGMKASRAYACNEVAFVTGFFLSRVLGNILVLHHMQTHLHVIRPLMEQNGLPVAVYYLLPVLAYAHGLLQFYWFALLARMVVRKLTNGQRTGEEASSSSRLSTTRGEASAVLRQRSSYSNAGSREGSDSDEGVYSNPPIAQTEKASKILGLPPTNVQGRTIRKLGLDEVATGKSAAVLGISSSSLGDASPPPPRRKRSSIVTAA
ncbi:hypothetical protein HKX48_006200 [Thoreauomyces humboldtii]|nr:hypothetical protein HKX48_006200 [Thoreauomyces humboldtii]